VLNASVIANNNAGTQQAVNCELLLDDSMIDETSSDATGIELGTNTAVGSRESIALTGAGTLAAPGTAQLVCNTTTSSGNWLGQTLTAIKVNALTAP
jgi:hypothetical protein